MRNKRRNINDYNRILESSNANLRVIKITKDFLLFNNGVELSTEEEVRNFRNRLKSPPSSEILKRIDAIYGDNIELSLIALNEARLAVCSIAGKQAWVKSGDEIKKKMKGRSPPNKGQTGIYKYGPPTDEHRRKISLANSGENNGMYGKRMSDEDKEKKSILIKNRILNGEFTPCTNNRNTHWDSCYNNEKFRSSWEALYKYSNPNAVHEKLRIPYVYNGVEKIYIVDFIDEVSKLAIEVKPTEMCKSEAFYAKFNALSTWAKDNNYTVLLADQEWLITIPEPTDYSLFDEKTSIKIKKFYETYKKNRNRKT